MKEFLQEVVAEKLKQILASEDSSGGGVGAMAAGQKMFDMQRQLEELTAQQKQFQLDALEQKGRAEHFENVAKQNQLALLETEEQLNRKETDNQNLREELADKEETLQMKIDELDASEEMHREQIADYEMKLMEASGASAEMEKKLAEMQESLGPYD